MSFWGWIKEFFYDVCREYNESDLHPSLKDNKECMDIFHYIEIFRPQCLGTFIRMANEQQEKIERYQTKMDLNPNNNIHYSIDFSRLYKKE